MAAWCVSQNSGTTWLRGNLYCTYISDSGQVSSNKADGETSLQKSLLVGTGNGILFHPTAGVPSTICHLGAAHVVGYISAIGPADESRAIWNLTTLERTFVRACPPV